MLLISLQQFLPIFLLSFVMFLLFFLGLGIGYLVNKRPLKGSCGGVANLMGDEYCQFCGNDPQKCAEISDTVPTTSINRSASQLSKVSGSAKHLGTVVK